jgi:flagellum-specific peptidoglycan hydrolase FlgJ
MPLVADTSVTFSSRADFAKQLFSTFISLGLSKGAAQLLTAHAAVSTNWGKGAGNYRLFGIRAGGACVCDNTCSPSYSGNYTCTKNKRTGITYPWRAYSSLAEGAAAALALLKNARYKTSYSLLLKGDDAYFAQVGYDGWYEESVPAVAAEMQAALLAVQQYTGGKYTISTTGISASTALAVGILIFVLVYKFGTRPRVRSRRS